MKIHFFPIVAVTQILCFFWAGWTGVIMSVACMLAGAMVMFTTLDKEGRIRKGKTL